MQLFGLAKIFIAHDCQTKWCSECELFVVLRWCQNQKIVLCVGNGKTMGENILSRCAGPQPPAGLQSRSWLHPSGNIRKKLSAPWNLVISLNWNIIFWSKECTITHVGFAHVLLHFRDPIQPLGGTNNEHFFFDIFFIVITTVTTVFIIISIIINISIICFTKSVLSLVLIAIIIFLYSYVYLYLVFVHYHSFM